MGILGTLRRLSPIPLPRVIELPAEELAWPTVEAPPVVIPPVEAPGLSRDLTLTAPPSHQIAVLDAPAAADLNTYLVLPAFEVVDLGVELLLASFEVVDLLDPLSRPAAHGTIFIKKEEKTTRGGEIQTKTRVEPFRSQTQVGPRMPAGLDIFEMLLPILMPPAGTEFRDELLFPAELYPFQRVGVKWLFENGSALLADDMGLGKTVQAITAFRALIRRSLALQALVICPKSVATNWMREMERWAPELVARRVHGSQRDRRIAWQAYVGKCHVLVATYETVRQDREFIKGRFFDLIVCDEIQRIKNPETATSRAVRSLEARRRWGLTGTPLENRLEDVLALFAFIKPGLFSRHELSPPSAQYVRERIHPYVLRRRKKEVLPELPDKVVDTKWLELTESQQRAYRRAKQEGIVRLRGSDTTVTHVLALIQRLKQICNFDPNTGDSAKMKFVREDFLEEACVDNQKALIVSQHVETLKQIEERVKDYDPLVYTGQLSDAQRDKILKSFDSEDEHKVLLLSLRAGGAGLNLQRANHVLHFDRWWNPAVERQAEDRTHRIGQLRAVFVTRLVCQGTIEEDIEQILERKKFLFQEVVDELADTNLERVLSEEEIFGLFGLTPPRRSRHDEPPPVPGLHLPQPAAPAPTARRAEVIRPEEPYSNVARLRRILRESEEYIWWADRYFRARGLEELLETVDPALVQEVHILSGPDNVNERSKRDMARFAEEMQLKGITAEWRILKGFSHDRYLVSRNACFNVPSIDTILRGEYSEMNETPNWPPFEIWWENATPIENWKPE